VSAAGQGGTENPWQATLQRLIADFHARPLPPLTPRDTPLRFVRDVSLAIVGARRCGKTYRTYQFIRDHLERGGHIENVCRVQFRRRAQGGRQPRAYGRPGGPQRAGA
jgi:hypothetical protein